MSDSLIYEDKISHSFCDKVIDFYNTNLDRSQKLVERGKKSNQIFKYTYINGKKVKETI